MRIAVLAFTIIATMAATRPAQGQFSALPGVVRLSAADTAQMTLVQIRNEGETTMQFRLYMGDYDQAENGDYTFIEYGNGPASCSGRMSFFPDNVVLQPGERQEVQVRMEPGTVCWSLLFIESSAGGEGQVQVAQRIGVRVLNVPPVLTHEGEVLEVAAEPGDSVTVDFAFKNSGTAPVELRGAIEIRDLNGAVLATAEVGPLGVLPGHIRRVNAVIGHDLTPGRYLAVPILDFGGEYLAGGQALFTVQ